MKFFTLIAFFCVPFPGAALAGQDSALLLYPSVVSSDSAASINKFNSDMAARGISVTEMPSDEVQDARQAAFASGSSTVVKVESTGGKIELRAYDAATGKDISKTFYGAPVEPKPQPAPAVKQIVPVMIALEIPKPIEKPTARSDLGENKVFLKNHIGLSIGPSNFTKNKDSLEMLQQNNVNSQITYRKAGGRFQLFYERDLSRKYTLGLSGEFANGSSAIWDNNGRTLLVEPKHKVANVYIRRNFGRHFGLYLGGGADMMTLRVIDRGNMAGVGDNVLFNSDITATHAEAGVAVSAGNFSLRFSLRKILAAESKELITTANGSRSRLTIKNGKTLSTKAEGQPLGANEQLYKADSGGTATAVALTYSFANW